MSHIELTAFVAFWSAASITLVGCGEAPQSSQPAKVSSQNHNPKAEAADNGAQRSQTYVTCRATFTTFETDYPWFDDSSVGHDDGTAPLASFVLIAVD